MSVYGTNCVYCGKEQEKWTLDHVVPVSGQGTNDIWNTVPACEKCNHTKDNQPLEQWLEPTQLQQLEDLLMGVFFQYNSTKETHDTRARSQLLNVEP